MRFKKGEFQFGFQDLVRTGDFDGEKIEIKMKKNKKKNKRGLRGHFLALGRMTYSHLLNRIFI